MDVLLRILVGWLVLLYVIAPIVLRFVQKMSADPKLEVLDSEKLSREVWDYLHGTAEALRQVGFHPVAYLAMPNAVPNVQAYLVMLYNPLTQDKSLITAFFGKQGKEWKLQTCYVEYSTRYEDGRVFDTNNSSVLGSFQRPEKSTTAQLPSVHDAGQLYQIHRYQLDRLAPNVPKKVPDAAPAEYLNRVIVESYDQQVAYGRLFLDRRANAYRPTWKGAFLMTWGQAWPVTWFRRRLLEKEEKALLAQFQSDLAAGRWPQATGPVAAPATSA